MWREMEEMRRTRSMLNKTEGLTQISVGEKTKNCHQKEKVKKQ